MISPCDEERLIKLVIEVENDVVIGHNIKPWTGKLAIDKYNLQ